MLARIQPSRLQGCVTVPPPKAWPTGPCSAPASPPDHQIRDLALPGYGSHLRALTALGASIARQGSLARVQGVAGRPKVPQGPVDCGESGSTLRFLIPAFALLRPRPGSPAAAACPSGP